MANGDVSVVVPAGWKPPAGDDPGAAAGYVSATGGSGANTIAVTGTGPWTVTVSGVTLDQGAAQTLPMNYGDTAGGGAGGDSTGSDGRRHLDDEAALIEPRCAHQYSRPSRRSPSTRQTEQAPSHRASRPSPAPGGLIETLTYTAPAGGLSNGIAHGCGACWVGRTPDLGGSRLHDDLGRRRVRGRADDHRHRSHPYRRPDRGDHVRLGGDGDRGGGPRRAGVAGPESSTAAACSTAIGASPTITVEAADASGS